MPPQSTCYHNQYVNITLEWILFYYSAELLYYEIKMYMTSVEPRYKEWEV